VSRVARRRRVWSANANFMRHYGPRRGSSALGETDVHVRQWRTDVGICRQSPTSPPPPKRLHGYWHLLVTGVADRAGWDRDGGVYDDAMLVTTPICDDSGGREQLEWTDRVDGCGCCTAAAANTGAVPGVVHHLQPIDLRANRPSARR